MRRLIVLLLVAAAALFSCIATDTAATDIESDGLWMQTYNSYEELEESLYSEKLAHLGSAYYRLNLPEDSDYTMSLNRIDVTDYYVATYYNISTYPSGFSFTWHIGQDAQEKFDNSTQHIPESDIAGYIEGDGIRYFYLVEQNKLGEPLRHHFSYVYDDNFFTAKVLYFDLETALQFTKLVKIQK